MSNNIYDILNKLNTVEQKSQPLVQQQFKKKTQLAENIATIESQLNEKYMGFKKTVAAVAKGGSAENPEAVAAAIGRKKYGKEKFQQAAAQGKKLGEDQKVAEEQQDESALQAYLGKKKYGEQGMKALQQAGREGASKETMAKIRAKHDKMDEVAPPGAKAERMVKHVKKGYAKDGKLTPQEKSIAYATAWKAHKAGKVEEAVNALRVLSLSGMTAEQITEGWEEMMKAVQARHDSDRGTGKFTKEKDPVTGGTKYIRKYNPKTGETDDTENVTVVKRGRGRPKKHAFETYLESYENILEQSKSTTDTTTTKPAPAPKPAPASTMGTIKGGVWTADPPKKGEKGVPVPVPVDENDANPELSMGAGKPFSRERITSPEPELSMGATGVTRAQMDRARENPIPPYAPLQTAADKAKFSRAFRGATDTGDSANYVGTQPEGDYGATGNPDKPVKITKPQPVDTYPPTYILPDKESGRTKALKNEQELMPQPTPEPTKTKHSVVDADLDEMMRLAGMEDVLKGGQKKLDKNKNGRLDATDFAILRGEQDQVDEVSRGEYIKQQDTAAEKAGKKSFTAFGQKFSTDQVQEARQVCTECGMSECGCASPVPSQEQEGRMSINMNVNSDGTQSLNVNAEGSDAVKLAQILKLAGLGSGQAQAVYSPVQMTMGEQDHEEVEEAKDERYHASTTPDEEVYGVDVLTKGGNGDVAGQEKRMHKHGYQFGDNPIAMKETVARDYESIKVKK
jgi:hypothetical protein